MPRKILITGPIRGQFDTLSKRLQSVQSKAGPFEAVFCIGNLTGDATPDAIEKFISDSQEFPFPTYVLDDQGSRTCIVYAVTGGRIAALLSNNDRLRSTCRFRNRRAIFTD